MNNGRQFSLNTSLVVLKFIDDTTPKVSPECPTAIPQEIPEYLLKNTYLGEFRTEEKKNKVKNNLGISNKDIPENYITLKDSFYRWVDNSPYPTIHPDINLESNLLPLRINNSPIYETLIKVKSGGIKNYKIPTNCELIISAIGFGNKVYSTPLTTTLNQSFEGYFTVNSVDNLEWILLTYIGQQTLEDSSSDWSSSEDSSDSWDDSSSDSSDYSESDSSEDSYSDSEDNSSSDESDSSSEDEFSDSSSDSSFDDNITME